MPRHYPATPNDGSADTVALMRSSLVKLHQLLAVLHSHAASIATSSGAAPVPGALQLDGAITLTTEIFGAQTKLFQAVKVLCSPSPDADGPGAAQGHRFLPSTRRGECMSCAKLTLQLHSARTQIDRWKARLVSNPATPPGPLQLVPLPPSRRSPPLASGRHSLMPDSLSSTTADSQPTLCAPMILSPAIVFRDSAPTNANEDDSSSDDVITQLPSTPATALGIKRQGSDLHIAMHAKRPRVAPPPVPLEALATPNSGQATIPDPAAKQQPLAPAAPLDISALFASLPPLPQSPANAAVIHHATPTALWAQVDKITRNKPYRTRYDSSGALLTHAPSTRVIHHLLLPVRPLDAPGTAAYLAFLHQNPLFKHRSPSNIIDVLLPRGLGAHVSHAQLNASIAILKRARNILYAFNRPVLLVGMVARDVRPDLWDALVARAPRSTEISATAVLGLLLGVECVGLEEPTAESQVPAKMDRVYCVRERIAIVEPSKGRRGLELANLAPWGAHVEDSSSENGGEDDEEHVEEEEDAGMDLNTTQPTHSTGQPSISTQPNTSAASSSGGAPPAYLTFPPSLVPTGPTPGRSRLLRYVSGRLQVHSKERVLAHELVPARDLSASLISQYLANALPCFRAAGMPRRAFEYAVRRGSAQPFSYQTLKRDLAASNVEFASDSTLLTAIRLTVSRPLFVVDELEGGEHEEVRQRLLEQAGRESSGGQGQEEEEAAARLVMLLGLELVGLELPRESDLVPANRMYVVRERYALVV